MEFFNPALTLASHLFPGGQSSDPKEFWSLAKGNRLAARRIPNVVHFCELM
jgi:hypothetical protein